MKRILSVWIGVLAGSVGVFAAAQVGKRAPDFTISRLEAKKFSNHPVWIEEIRTHFIAGLRKAGVPE